MPRKRDKKFTSADVVTFLGVAQTYTEDGAFASAIRCCEDALGMLRILQAGAIARMEKMSTYRPKPKRA